MVAEVPEGGRDDLRWRFPGGSRTIADLEGAERVTEIHLSGAIAFRMSERADCGAPAAGGRP
jgi:hypothetical protein